MPRFTGNTVEEALQIALTALNATKEHVTVTIIDEGKKGFLGMGKKEAVVEVELQEAGASAPADVATTAKPKVATTVAPQVAPQPVVEAAVVKNDNVEVIVDELAVDVKEEVGLGDDEALRALALYLVDITKFLGAPADVHVEKSSAGITFDLDTKKQGMLIGKHGKILNALQYLSQVYLHRVAENKLTVVINVGDYRARRQEILERLAAHTAEKVARTHQAVFLEPMPAFERKQIHSALSSNPAVETYSEGDEPYRHLVVAPAKK